MAKSFLLQVLGLLGAGLQVVIDGLDLIAAIGAYFGRRLGLIAALAGAIGLSAPLTGGWNDTIGGSPWLVWLPVLALPVAILLIALIVESLRHLDKEAIRSFSRRAAERPNPRLEHELEVEVERRKAITEELEKSGLSIPLEEQDFVTDDLHDLYFEIKRHSDGDFKIVLMGWTGNRLVPVAKRGEVPAAMRDRLVLGFEDLTGIREALDNALEPLRYRHYVVPFSAGMYSHYVLVGLSGATIPLEVRLEISRTATKLLAHHNYGDELPGWASGGA